jgi:hypothetical protein
MKMSNEFEDCIKRHSSRPFRQDYGFGMCRLKGEGAPMHPDDDGIGKSNPLYDVQLKMYSDYLKEVFKHTEYSKTVVITAQPDCTQSTTQDKQ